MRSGQLNQNRKSIKFGNEIKKIDLYLSLGGPLLMAGGGGLPVMAYMKRLHPKGVSFSGFRFMKE